MIKNLFHGFCMALADSVPGVSGGTIAFILGFYDQFITSLDDLLTGSFDKKKVALTHLIKLGIGWAIGFISSVSILVSIFDTYIYEISSLFIGFIIFAIPIVYLEEKKELKTNIKTLSGLLIGLGFVILISSLNSGLVSEIDLAQLSIPSAIYIFVVAMIAISAMVLPGISGSTLLLIFGLYMPVLSAIKALITFNFTYLPAIIIFGLGILAGIATVVKIIKWALNKHRSFMIYFILGMMIGSLYAICQGPTTLEVPRDAMGLDTFSILFFFIGGIIIFGLQFAKMKLESKKA